jgi:hypothetical protein
VPGAVHYHRKGIEMRIGRGTAIAGVVLLAVLTACGGDGTSGPQAPTTATPSSAPSVTMAPFGESDDPVAVEPGTYMIPASEWSVADFSVTFPQGWGVQYGNVFLKHWGSDDELGLDTALVDEIFADACAGSNGDVVDVGPGVDDLATALLKQKGPKASDPVETTLGSLPATRIDLTVPKGFDLKPCNVKDIGLQIWYSAPADKYLVLFPGVTASVYLVEIDGQRQVFVTQHPSSSSDEDLEELQAVLDSIDIEM